MSAADGCTVVRITDKTGGPIRRSWRVAVQLPGPPPVLGMAVLVAEHATEAARLVRANYPGCDIFDVEAIS